MDLEDDPLTWAAAHLPTMTDAEANQAVGRLVAAGVAPVSLLTFLPPIATALRTGAAEADDDPAERLAEMNYRGLPDPLLALAADFAMTVPDSVEWALAWVDAECGLQAQESLVSSALTAVEIAERLRAGRADRFALVVPWYAPSPQVDVLLGCPTGRMDVVRSSADGTWAEVEDPGPWSLLADVMQELELARPSRCGN